MGTRYQGTDGEVRALNTCIKLIRAAESVSHRIHQHLEAVDLTISQFGVLEAIWHLGPLSQRDLAQKILKSGGNLTLVIDNLEKRQLVARHRQTHDRRVIHVHLTETGEHLIRTIFPHHVAAITREMNYLTPTEQEELARLCRKLGKQSME